MERLLIGANNNGLKEDDNMSIKNVQDIVYDIIDYMNATADSPCINKNCAYCDGKCARKSCLGYIDEDKEYLY